MTNTVKSSICILEPSEKCEGGFCLSRVGPGGKMQPILPQAALIALISGPIPMIWSTRFML
jgi:hypothetical protein